MNPKLVAFRDAKRVQARGLVTCGFELETQRSEGETYEGVCEYGEEVFDEDAYYEAVDERLSEALRCLDDFYGLLPVGMLSKDELREHYLDTLEALVKAKLLTQTQADYVEERMRDRVLYWVDSGDFTERRTQDPTEFFSDRGLDTHLLEVDEDGSVRGFEFRTRGAPTYMQFRKAAENVFGLSHRIDERCSFHIHLAVKGATHKYGTALQHRMIEFLVENIDKVPASVRERWAKIGDNQFIRGLYDSQEKYSFIHFHNQGTWEFRCFGNVKNAKDGLACLDLAIAALQHAYKVRDGLAEPLVSGLEDLDADDWEGVVFTSLEQSQPLSKTLRGRQRKAA